jgi:hypothetical protein
LVLVELQHLNDGLAALHVRFVNYDEREPLEPLVSLLSTAAGQESLLRCDHNLGWPVVTLSYEVGHLNVGIAIGDLTHLVGGLPDKLTHRSDDQRPAFNAICQRGEYDGLASAGEQTNERGLNATLHCVQQRFDDFRLVGAQSEHENILVCEEARGRAGRRFPLSTPGGAEQRASTEL